jgi:L-aminopeptidase/D-esterase-like protein
VDRVHAVTLAGGSAFGLNAADGVMRYLEQRGVGFDTGLVKVPIVPAAILFDLDIGDPLTRPDADMGYQACSNASSDPPAEGNVGAGCGASVGKLFGMMAATKSGIGTASALIDDHIVVGAIFAVNALGNIIDPATSRIIAGIRDLTPKADRGTDASAFMDSLDILQTVFKAMGSSALPANNTVIGVIATNASLDKGAANFVAQMAQDGIARTIQPAHTLLDGDTIFSLSTGKLEADVNVIGAWAAEVTAQAIIRAVKSSRPLGGLPAAADFQQ